MAKTLKDHLIDTFDDMTEDNVKKFTRKLCDRSQEPRVRRGAIEKIKDSLDLADLMVDTFTSIGAVTVTIELLQAINCNQQAVSLSEATGQTEDRGSANVTPGSSSAPSNAEDRGSANVTPGSSSAPSNAEDRGSANVTPGSSSAPSNGQQFIDKHRKQLIERVRNVDAILDELLEKKIISHEEYDKIRSKSTPTEKMREIFSGPMISAGNAGKLALYEALMNLQHVLMMDLGAQ